VGSTSRSFGRYKDASRFWLNEERTIQSITVYFANSGFSAKTAIYTDVNGAPSSLIVQSTSQSISQIGWATFAVQEMPLAPGYYWLSVVCDNRNANGTMVPASANEHARKRAYYSSEFTSSFGVPSGFDAFATSIYATCVSAASLQPTPTPTPTPAPTSSPAALILPPNPVALFAPLSGVNAYSDEACTNPVTSIDWGTLSVGGTKNVTIYVRNEVSDPVTLEKTVTWYTANASTYITLSWDYKSQTLTASSVIRLVLTLAVALNIPASIREFSFDLTITATG
jgi:hypothetical protein